MSVAGTERRRQLVTAGILTALGVVMGVVLVFGFRLATHMRAEITALQAASTLQTYPDEISHQLNSLRDRLEVRAYSGKALTDLQETVKHFDQELKQINAGGEMDSPQLARAQLLWHAVRPGARPGDCLRRPALRRLRQRRQHALARGTRALRGRSSAHSCSPPTTPMRCRRSSRPLPRR